MRAEYPRQNRGLFRLARERAQQLLEICGESLRRSPSETVFEGKTFACECGSSNLLPVGVRFAVARLSNSTLRVAGAIRDEAWMKTLRVALQNSWAQGLSGSKC